MNVGTPLSLTNCPDGDAAEEEMSRERHRELVRILRMPAWVSVLVEWPSPEEYALVRGACRSERIQVGCG
jgi:hypothetical protein